MKNFDNHKTKYQKFVDDCNNDSGYANSHAAGIERGEIDEAWIKDYPQSSIPSTVWSNKSGKYELTNFPDLEPGSV